MAYLQRTTLPNTSTLFPLSCYSSFSPALILLSLQSCFNQNIISEKKKKKNPANKQVTSKPRKTSFQQGNIFKYLDCYFSISLSFTCCRLNSLHISSPRKKEAFFFNFALFVGTSKEDFSNFHLYRKP